MSVDLSVTVGPLWNFVLVALRLTAPRSSSRSA